MALDLSRPLTSVPWLHKLGRVFPRGQKNSLPPAPPPPAEKNPASCFSPRKGGSIIWLIANPSSGKSDGVANPESGICHTDGGGLTWPSLHCASWLALNRESNGANGGDLLE